MISAAGEAGLSSDCYSREEEDSSSVVVKCKSKEDNNRLQNHKAKIKPDAAVTLAPGWDPFTMLLIHIVYPYDEQSYTVDNVEPYIIHGDKESPTMTKM